jgi:acetolactate decarboxylase
MKRLFNGLLSSMLFLLVGCDARSVSQQPSIQHQITQVSIINALMLGQYDGVMTIRELLQYGNFGLGACDHLDGELIVLDGKAYEAKADGTVAEIAPESKTPFAIVTPLEKIDGFAISNPASLEELEGQLDKVLANHNLFYAIRVDAEFASITIRSVARQEPPYSLLVDVAKDQKVWTHDNVKGSLVGFRSPKWVTGLSVPGYHWHFLSSDHKLGGHVLDGQIRSGAVAYDRCDSWLIKLHESLGSNGKDLSLNLSRELEQVEELRGNEQHEKNP